MVKIENCCKIGGIDTTIKPVGCAYLCGCNPIDGLECKHRPMVNASGDWCDHFKLIEHPSGAELGVCDCAQARLEAIDGLVESLTELKKSMLI